MTHPQNTAHRCIDALDRVDWTCRNIDGTTIDDDDRLLALRHAVAALQSVLHTHPTLAERLKSDVANMCTAVGVDGP